MKWFDHIPKSASGAKEPYMGGSQSAVLIRYAPKPQISYFVRPHANLEVADAILKAEAPLVQLYPPDIETLEDSTPGGERKLRLRLVSPRQARILWLQIEKATVLAATLEGRKVQLSEVDKRNKVWGLVYVAMPAGGIELDLTLNPSESPQLTVIDQSDGFPSLPRFHVESRPNNRMSLPVAWPFFDSTVLVSHMYRTY